jgi:hypothetical protein
MSGEAFGGKKAQRRERKQMREEALRLGRNASSINR